MSDPVCPLCERPIPPDAPQSLHHLIPKLKGGKGGPTILIHHICHKEIHATLTEVELARSYASVAQLGGVENGKINICFASVKRRYYVGAKVNETLIQHRD